MERGPNIYHQILGNGLVGTPDKIAEKLKDYSDAGIEQFFLAFQDPFDANALELFIDSTKR